MQAAICFTLLFLKTTIGNKMTKFREFLEFVQHWWFHSRMTYPCKPNFFQSALAVKLTTFQPILIKSFLLSLIVQLDIQASCYFMIVSSWEKRNLEPRTASSSLVVEVEAVVVLVFFIILLAERASSLGLVPPWVQSSGVLFVVSSLSLLLVPCVNSLQLNTIFEPIFVKDTSILSHVGCMQWFSPSLVFEFHLCGERQLLVLIAIHWKQRSSSSWTEFSLTPCSENNLKMFSRILIDGYLFLDSQKKSKPKGEELDWLLVLNWKGNQLGDAQKEIILLLY